MFRLLFIATLLATTLTAANPKPLKLANGLTLTNWRVLSESPTTLTIQHKGGALKIKKTDLPPELAAKYPVNAEAAEKEEQEIIKGLIETEVRKAEVAAKKAVATKKGTDSNISDSDLKAAREEGRREAELEVARAAGRQDVKDAAAEKAKRDAMVEAHNARQMGFVTDEQAEMIHAAARSRAEQYFKVEQKAPASALTIELRIEMNSPQAVPGWRDRYEVSGVAWWQSLESQGGFSGGRKWFRAVVDSRRGPYRVVDFRPFDTDPMN